VTDVFLKTSTEECVVCCAYQFHRFALSIRNMFGDHSNRLVLVQIYELVDKGEEMRASILEGKRGRRATTVACRMRIQANDIQHTPKKKKKSTKIMPRAE